MKRLFSFLGALLMSGILSANESFDLVSYNIRYAARGDGGTKAWDARKGTVTEYLKNSGAGFIGLQEVLHHQLQDVAKALPEMKYIGLGRDDGKQKGESSPIFYDPKKWTLDEQNHGTFWLSETPDVPGSKSWGNSITRICTWARFVGKDGKAFYLYNTHWDHRSQPSREKSAALIAKMISTRKFQKEPYVVMGDFNATTGNPAIVTLMDSAKLVDHGGEKQKATFNQWKPGLKDGMRIDHIFTSKDLKVSGLKVESNGDPVGADHHPVILRGASF